MSTGRHKEIIMSLDGEDHTHITFQSTEGDEHICVCRLYVVVAMVTRLVDWMTHGGLCRVNRA
jgi:hypothetical protein